MQENPEKLNVVEAVLNEKMSTLTQSRLDSLTQKIGLLLRSSAKTEIDDSVESPIHVKVFEIFPQRHTGTKKIIYFNSITEVFIAQKDVNKYISFILPLIHRLRHHIFHG